MFGERGNLSAVGGGVVGGRGRVVGGGGGVVGGRGGGVVGLGVTLVLDVSDVAGVVVGDGVGHDLAAAVGKKDGVAAVGGVAGRRWGET